MPSRICLLLPLPLLGAPPTPFSPWFGRGLELVFFVESRQVNSKGRNDTKAELSGMCLGQQLEAQARAKKPEKAVPE